MKKGLVRAVFPDKPLICLQTVQSLTNPYPIEEWNGIRKGAVALYGHQHNYKNYNLANRRDRILRYDVGVDANDMEPVSAEEILNFFYQ